MTNVDSSGDLLVKFKTHTHLLNPSCCVKVCDAELPVRQVEDVTRSEVKSEVRSEMKTEVKVIEKEEADLQPQESSRFDIEEDTSCSKWIIYKYYMKHHNLT